MSPKVHNPVNSIPLSDCIWTSLIWFVSPKVTHLRRVHFNTMLPSMSRTVKWPFSFRFSMINLAYVVLSYAHIFILFLSLSRQCLPQIRPRQLSFRIYSLSVLLSDTTRLVVKLTINHWTAWLYSFLPERPAEFVVIHIRLWLSLPPSPCHLVRICQFKFSIGSFPSDATSIGRIAEQFQ